MKPSCDVKEMVCVCVIIAPHGVRGAVRIKPYTRGVADIFQFEELFDDSGRRYSLKKHAVKSDIVVAYIDGVSDRDVAIALRNTKLYINRSALPAVGNGEYYHIDLIGMDVLYENGTIVGRVTSVQNFGAGDIIEISSDGDSFYYPFNKSFVREVDTARGVMIIEPLGDIQQ